MPHHLRLRDAHCDPPAIRNLLSVSAIVDRGLSFFSNATGKPTGLVGPEVYFVDIVCNGGLYIFDGVTSVSPVDRVAGSGAVSMRFGMGRLL